MLNQVKTCLYDLSFYSFLNFLLDESLKMVQYAGAKGNKNKILGITIGYQKIVATYSRYSDQY